MFCFGSLCWLRPSSDSRERSALLCEVLLLWDPHRNELPASFKHVLPFYFWKRWGLYLTSLRTMKEKASLRHVGALLPPKPGFWEAGLCSRQLIFLETFCSWGQWTHCSCWEQFCSAGCGECWVQEAGVGVPSSPSQTNSTGGNYLEEAWRVCWSARATITKFPGGSDDKEFAFSAGDPWFDP